MRLKIFSLTTLIAVQLAAGALGAQSLPPEVISYADTVLYNGKILTVDSQFTIVQALAVRDGKILKTGADREILPLAGPRTKRIDLQGKTVIPGLIDTHSHLHEYGLDRFAPEMNPKLLEIKIEGRTEEEMLERLAEAAKTKQPGEWLITRIRPRNVADGFVLNRTRWDLDRVTGNVPALVHVTDTKAMANSRALEELLKRYDPKLLDLPKNAAGEFTGRIGAGVSLIFYEEIVPKPKPEELAPIYLKELERWGAAGITTWSSSLGSEAISAFHYMDQKGMMPIRLAYTNEAGYRDNIHAESFVSRFGNLIGHGTDYFWLIGISSGSTDSSYPGVCTTLSPDPKIKAREDCRLAIDNVRGRAAYAAVKAGLRIAGTHSAGDKATDVLMDIIEKASAEAGFSLEQIRAKNHVIDHCTMNPRPDQIERAKKLNIMWSCAPKYLLRAERVMRDYGEEAAHRWVVPVKSILDAGGRVTWEQDDADLGTKPFFGLATLITRKDENGKVWGARNAVDRKTALLMATRWASEYVLREKTLGSLERGKWADLVVLDKDYMTVPDDEIATIQSVMTMVGGKIIYSALP
ncbi:MAG TPA: amidohydrolase family protein [Candidatus Acidoferrales bacterium]|nr:amidohydrolase family protein [Candidatus Acidoferrales bacterium]